MLVLSVFIAPSASAHDVLVSSDPEDGAEVEAPTGFTLTFNNEPLEVNPVVSISGPDGQESALEVEPVVEGRDVYVELPDLEAGEYDVSWRIVSSDGHPISGEQSFTVLPGGDDAADDDAADDQEASDPDESVSSDDETGTEDETDGAGDDTDASDDGSVGDSEQESAVENGEDSAGLPVGAWVAIGIGAVVVLGLLAAYALRKKGEKPAEETPSQSEEE